MKFLHTGDLHIGKTLCEFSLLEDQKFILNQIVDIAAKEQVDAIVIAGDIYDRSIPPTEAVEILDGFLDDLVKLQIKVMMISGNHDSPERLGFGSRFMEGKGIYIEGSFKGEVRKITLEDQHGPVHFYLLPFIKRSVAQPYLKGEPKTMQDVVQGLLQSLPNQASERNVLVTHYFVTNKGQAPALSDSENTVSVGGIDNIEVSLFSDFTYTALGHIHGPQQIGQSGVYYAGSPLKYSFSEVHHKKGVQLVELGESGEALVKQIPLTPFRDLRRVKGSLSALTSEEVYSLANTSDYLAVELTDEDELYDPIGKLRAIYPNVCQLSFTKNQGKKENAVTSAQDIKNKTPLALFEEFYYLVTEKELDAERRKMIKDVIIKAEGGADE